MNTNLLKLVALAEGEGEYACDNCGSTPLKLLSCPCMMVSYCGKGCQTLHWSVHKQLCPKRHNRADQLKANLKTKSTGKEIKPSSEPEENARPSFCLPEDQQAQDRAFARACISSLLHLPSSERGGENRFEIR
jgi:hypothetical protein